MQGYLDSSWSDDFGGLVVSNQVAEDGAYFTTLTGWLIDQAALFGVLKALYDMRLPLLSVECLDAN